MRGGARGFALALVLLASQQSAACVNSFGTDREGRQSLADDATGEQLAWLLTGGGERSYWTIEAHRYRDKALHAPSYENATNFGVSLLYQGRTVPALRLFLRLEQAYPGRAQTAANIGTALELLGKDAVALQWIRLGIRRDPREHDGTEWLHVRILEAKLAHAAGTWSRNRSIAGIAFDDALVPALPTSLPAGNDGKSVSLQGLDAAFRYQLSERMQFVAPKDWVVANLLSDWALLNMAGGPLENAKSLHALALRYGQQQSLQWAQRTMHIDRIVAKGRDAEAFNCPICAPRRHPSSIVD